MSTPNRDNQASSKNSVSKFWINGTNGRPSMSATFATIAFFTTTLAYLASIVTKIGPLTFRSFDPAAASSYMIPVMTLYFSRRYTDAKFENSSQPPTESAIHPVSPDQK